MGDRVKQELADKVSDNTDNEIKIIDVSKYKPKKIPPPTWREWIKKVWEVDPLKCPNCTCEMKIISFINEPDVIRKILEHLDLWNIPEQPRPLPEGRFTSPLHNPCPAITEQDDFDFFDDGWHGYEEPYITRD
jgi:hypothetical protein